MPTTSLNDDTKTLPSRQATPEEQTIIDEVLSLYQARPTEQSYAHYAPTAVFHDPVSIAKGLPSIQSQFNGMPKAFSSSTTESYRVLDDPSAPDCLRLDLTQRYVFKTGQAKTLNSLVTLRRGADGRIVHHEEEWDHKENRTGEDGFLGRLNEWRKKADAKLVEKMVPADPNKV
ncbi:hypothetical protein MMC15_006367 [Xylographa vitiligo]|nr:hypothetical protein [Xylographa vitiligo]